MKSVLISIQPKWCELIASGKKTVEVRKTRPKLDTPFKVYIYATKSGDRLVLKNDKVFEISKAITGKVIGEFVCDDIGEFKVFENGSVQYWNYHELGKTCLTYEELANYIGKNKDGYGWHISNLVIYDKPRELSEFYKVGYKDMLDMDFLIENSEQAKYWKIESPPQSWCYVESEVDSE